jgi:hypothetical protein
MVQLPLFDDPEVDYFVEDVVPEDWDEKIYLRSIPGHLDWMEVIKPLPCGNGYIPVGFKYNGASSGIFRKLIVLHFPKWKHRIATCRHDWRCILSDSREKRAFADKMFKIDVADGGTKWEQIKGYTAVRIGGMISKEAVTKRDPMLNGPKMPQTTATGKGVVSADEVDIETG